MVDIQIKNESLPKRCEICHQSDCFDAYTNTCNRCKSDQTLLILKSNTITSKYKKQQVKWKEVLKGVLICILLVINIFVLYIGVQLAKDRQHVIVVTGPTTVYDEWDVYAGGGIYPINNLQVGMEVRVLKIYSGIDSGGIKIKVPNGAIGYLPEFMERETAIKVANYDIHKKADYLSVGLVVTYIIVVIGIVMKRKSNYNKRIKLLLKLLLIISALEYLLFEGLL